MGVLTVVLDRIENLRDADGLGKSDPYVKFELEQDRLVFDKGYGKKQSSRKRNELSPVYDETFTFEDVPDLNNMVLHVKVKDADIGIDDTVGSCTFKLEDLGLSSELQEFDKIIDRKGLGIFRKHATVHLKLAFTE